VQIAFYPYAFERQDGGVKRARTPALMLTVLASHGRGRGAVTLASADPLTSPLVPHELLADEADRRRTLVDGCRLVWCTASLRRRRWPPRSCRGWTLTPAAAATTTGCTTSAPTRRWRITRPAPAALATMAGAVVDADLRVRGIEGLCVADNSVMLEPVSGNTQAAAYVIGAKAVGLCVADTD